MSLLDRPFAEYLMREIKLKNPTTGVLAEVVTERAMQDEKWGVQDHLPEKWNNIIMEEVGEACKAALESNPHTDQLMTRSEALKQWREELIQVAASAVAAVECYDRNEYFT